MTVSDYPDLTIRQLQEDVHETAVKHGWWQDVYTNNGDEFHLENVNVMEKLALIHSEISEAVEDYRVAKDLDDLKYIESSEGLHGFAIELADAIIRIADLAEVLDIDLNGALTQKMAYNKTRTYRHGGKRA